VQIYNCIKVQFKKKRVGAPGRSIDAPFIAQWSAVPSGRKQGAFV
jgi:hypothetical protein